jgi:hypothetical protein
VHKFDHQEIGAKAPIAQQLDISRNLLDRLKIVSQEITCNADQTRRSPIYDLSYLLTQSPQNKPLNILMVVHHPFKVEQTLIDDVFVYRPLIFNDDRTSVLIEAERVDSSPVNWASGIFGSQEAHSQ